MFAYSLGKSLKIQLLFFNNSSHYHLWYVLCYAGYLLYFQKSFLKINSRDMFYFLNQIIIFICGSVLLVSIRWHFHLNAGTQAR